MSPAVVRIAAAGDAAAVAELLRAYHEHTEAEKVAHELQEFGPLAPAYAAEVDAAAFPDADVLLAERDSQIIGMVVLRVDGADAEIKRLWVDPAVRGAGAGGALLAEAARRATAAGAASLRLSVWDWRHDALGLYRSRGFVEVASWETRERLVCLRMPLR
ncbi:GNAT family N-acetyltransferase [Microbacterium binotii]|uniref:GNAT family N-acetyltransferase n=1 Tax=Microbacterium binotii TaxID=462710 RepID=UPI001F38B11B|nr:GNAT family N-acetyltransferase [Microbacterium binotii]UIN30941.1 GNAT family N-acetyltransferase [Microbacterium binotii]